MTVLDRDELPEEPAARRGVPQSRQLHALLARGRAVLEDLFPGTNERLIASGALEMDLQSDLHWYLDGRLLRPEPSGLIGLAVSRPVVEAVIRSQVADMAEVTIMDGCDVTGLTSSSDRGRISGVRIRTRADGRNSSVLDADLVVDAAGRGAHTSAWLQELGYQPAPEESVRIELAYLSRFYRREAHHLGGRIGTAIAPYPGQNRSGFVNAQEGDRFMVTLSSCGGGELPTRDAAMAEYADSLVAPDVAEIIRTATPLTEPVLMRYPASVRRRYELLDRFPEGYLVIADALCSFNPIYGQGMTVAALEARLLQRLLQEDHDDLSRRFFTAVSELLDTPWSLIMSGDLRFPFVEGERSEGLLAMGEYLDRYRAAATHDATLATALIRVMNMVDEPARLMAPDLEARVRDAARAVPASDV
ncbi:FAD-binding monooxygenase [Pseudonocardia alaniniphila]|uniref:FAD-binding monooxygenase n=1 Tax=Pseudonocardia alaniniphila TaxID=75291 RepID=A0ABS9T9C1_9PSEU|nr:FAD-binding monooxygenase [Pseudonocardia alaniniphila]MCH6165124.1 FAD-binding monooxygenase [Pseudonocardia alaniniphila]